MQQDIIRDVQNSVCEIRKRPAAAQCHRATLTQEPFAGEKFADQALGQSTRCRALQDVLGAVSGGLELELQRTRT